MCSLKPKNHRNRGFAALSQAAEHPVSGDAAVVADGELGAVGEVDAGFLAAQGMDQEAERQEQPRHQRHEAGIARQLSEAIAVFVLDTMDVEGFEVLERARMEQRHDEHHLGQAELARTLPLAGQGQELPASRPFIELAKIVESAEQGRNIYGHEGVPPGLRRNHPGITSEVIWEPPRSQRLADQPRTPNSPTFAPALIQNRGKVGTNRILTDELQS